MGEFGRRIKQKHISKDFIKGRVNPNRKSDFQTFWNWFALIISEIKRYKNILKFYL